MTINEVVGRAGMPSIEMMLLKPPLTWIGHVVSMNEGRLSKAVFYGELRQAKQNDNSTTQVSTRNSDKGPSKPSLREQLTPK